MDNISKIASLFPENIKELILGLDIRLLAQITEIRVRRRLPLIIYISKTPFFLSNYGKLVNHFSDSCISLNDNDFDKITDIVCNNSYHTKMNTMINGYVTTNSGSRIGIASTAVYKDSAISSVKNISSLNIRIAKQVKNCSRKILNTLYVNELPSVIIAGPPACGKTTVLRDMTRLLSSGFAGKYRKISIIDEREELSSGFDVGINTDILKCFEKAKGIEIAVRTMSPELIVCDEIGNERELDAIKFGFSSGVSFAVSVHISPCANVFASPIIKGLTQTGQFNYIIILKDYTNEFDIYDISEANVENSGIYNDNDFFLMPWSEDC